MGICRNDGSGLCDSRNCLQNRDEKLQGKFAEREKGAVTMIVQTKKEAWEAAEKIFGTDYYNDEKVSYYAGYPIYVNDTSETNDQIADLDVRLEVRLKCNTVDCETTNIWIAEQIGEGITEEIEQEAEKLSDKFVFNYFNMNGKLSSKEFRKNTIFRIAAQALKKMKTANNTEELFDICHEAEILLEKEIKECQGYLTIFEPLTKVMFRWRREGKICHKKCYCTDDCTAIRGITQPQTSLTI